VSARDDAGRARTGPRTALALRYRHGVDAVPAVAAAGRGEAADRILDTARRAGVPVREDADLAQVLAHLGVGDTVPPELYRVIAELLAWAYRANHHYLLDRGD
jgi:flagellar biosynthesis protein